MILYLSANKKKPKKKKKGKAGMTNHVLNPCDGYVEVHYTYLAVLTYINI